MAALLRSDQPSSDDDAEASQSPEVAIIGFGPAGQIAARPLIDKGIRTVVIDLNQQGVRKAQQLGFHGEVGDATQTDVLNHAHLRDCKAVVITVPHHKSAMMILKHVRKDAPQARVIVRSRYELHMSDFAYAGAHVVTGDEQQVGESLAGHLRDWLDEAPSPPADSA